MAPCGCAGVLRARVLVVPMPTDLRNVTILCLLAPIMSVGLVYIIWVNGDTQTAGFAISLSVVVALVLMTAASVLLM